MTRRYEPIGAEPVSVRGHRVALVRDRQLDQIIRVYRRLGRWRRYERVRGDEVITDRRLVTAARRALKGFSASSGRVNARTHSGERSPAHHIRARGGSSQTEPSRPEGADEREAQLLLYPTSDRDVLALPAGDVSAAAPG